MDAIPSTDEPVIPPGTSAEVEARMRVLHSLFKPPPQCPQCTKKRARRMEAGNSIFDTAVTEIDAIVLRQQNIERNIEAKEFRREVRNATARLQTIAKRRTQREQHGVPPPVPVPVPPPAVDCVDIDREPLVPVDVDARPGPRSPVAAANVGTGARGRGRRRMRSASHSAVAGHGRGAGAGGDNASARGDSRSLPVAKRRRRKRSRNTEPVSALILASFEVPPRNDGTAHDLLLTDDDEHDDEHEHEDEKEDEDEEEDEDARSCSEQDDENVDEDEEVDTIEEGHIHSEFDDHHDDEGEDDGDEDLDGEALDAKLDHRLPVLQGSDRAAFHNAHLPAHQPSPPDVLQPESQRPYRSSQPAFRRWREDHWTKMSESERQYALAMPCFGNAAALAWWDASPPSNIIREWWRRHMLKCTNRVVPSRWSIDADQDRDRHIDAQHSSSSSASSSSSSSSRSRS